MKYCTKCDKTGLMLDFDAEEYRPLQSPVVHWLRLEQTLLELLTWTGAA